MRAAKFSPLPGTFLIMGLVLSLLLILFSIVGTFRGVSNLLTSLTKQAQADTNNFFHNLTNELNFLGQFGEVRNERDLLAQEVLKLASENSTLKSQIEDMKIIDNQLSFDLAYELEPVRVVRHDESRRGEIIINKGESSNLKTGQVLVLETFAIGEIVEVFPESARVRLVTSQQSSVPAKTVTSNIRGIVKSNFGVGLVLTEVLNEKKLEKGETVITTGINSNYPKGLILGEVSEIVSVESELTKQAKLVSKIDFNQLTELFVIKQ